MPALFKLIIVLTLAAYTGCRPGGHLAPAVSTKSHAFYSQSGHIWP